MSIFPWAEDPPGTREFPAYCRGCSIPIRQLNAASELWEDPAGLTTCVKARLEDIGGGRRPDFVLHQPMPAGLVGAPAGAEP